MKRIILSSLVLLFVTTLRAERIQLVLNSPKIPVPDTIWVFTPSGYDKQQTEAFPLVYLLHGWSGNYHQWNDITDCQKTADTYGFILVCPDGLYDSWYINSPVKKNQQYTDFFFLDLVPEIEKRFRINRERVFITGLSMGGHGALFLFSVHPEKFRSAGSLSGVVDLRDCSSEYGLPDLIGTDNTARGKELFLDYSAAGRLDAIAASGKEIIFSCGTDDRFYKINEAFKTACDEKDIPATFIPGPGGHDYPYWKNNLPAQLGFFAGLK